MLIKYYTTDGRDDSILRVVWNGKYVVMAEEYWETLGKWMGYPAGHIKSFLLEFDYREATEEEIMLEIL